MALSIDGKAVIDNGGSNASQSISLTTTKAGDLLILLVQQAQSTFPGSQSVISDSVGLSWTLRSHIVDNSTSQTRCEEWYAIWSGSGTITITAAFQTGSANGVIALMAFGVSGYDTSNIFDSGASSFPLSSTSPAQQASFNASYSTKDANTLVFIFYGGNFVGAGNQQTINTDPTYTTIETDLEANGFSTTSEYKINSSSVSGASLTAQDSTFNAFYSIIVDAIRQAVPAPPPSPTPSAPSSSKITILPKVTPQVSVPIYTAKQLIGTAHVPNGAQPNIETPVTAVAKIFKNGKYVG
jgi:hypothetical protein